ncbi:hypothetical protein EGW08_008604 [Elysia chlorotica]|uniref:lysoplasmalogenase n=1 Tax=Elysia chlorotica TaxID=188477 RepID=A0A433TQ51_ELYCH|nr:hypothetical protein EGW08_008604 [Elysia chlorotica]
MERKRPKTNTKYSPPRSTKGERPGTQCVPDIITRTFDLVTSKAVVPFYILAGGYSFVYASKANTAPTPRPPDYVVFAVLPLIYLMELVRHPPQTICPFHDHARRYILLGLIVCCIGDGLMAYNPDVHLVCWFGMTCIGFFFYSIAFFQYYRPGHWAKFVFPVSLIVTIVLIYMIGELKPACAVLIFSIFLTVLGFFALARLESCRTGPAYLGWAGVKLFALSSLLLALNLLVPSLESPISNTVVTMSYFLAQLGIALSTYTIQLCPASGSSSISPGCCESSASINSVN